MKVTALVPMKGYSERIPSKNTIDLNGKPLLYHMLSTLEKCDNVYETLVNTDDKNIKSIVNDAFPNVNVIDRPDYLLGTKKEMTPIIEYDIKHISTQHFLQTHVTNPLLKPKTIDNAIEEYSKGLEEGYDSVIGVTKYLTRFYNCNGKPVNHNINIMVPSQDMKPMYEDNSNFYINSIDNFTKHYNRVGINPKLVEVPKLESIDIDDEEDLMLVRLLMEHICQNA